MFEALACLSVEFVGFLARLSRWMPLRVPRYLRSPSGPSGLASVPADRAESRRVEVALMTRDTTVKICRRLRRFSPQGLIGLADQPQSGRPSAITPRQRAQIVAR